MDDSSGFNPDWVSPPGDTIADILRERGIPVAEFAAMMELTPAKTDELIRGVTLLTEPIAENLSRILGPSVRFWLKREAQYREGGERGQGGA